MNAIGVNGHRKIHLILIWLVIMSVSPFVFDKAGFIPPKLIVFVFVPVMLCLILGSRMVVEDRILGAIILVQGAYFLSAYFYYLSLGSYLIAFLSFMVVLIVYMYMSRFVGSEMMIRSLVIVIMVIAGGSVVGFMLSVLGIVEPTVLFERYSGENVYHVWTTFTNKVYTFGSRNMIRPSGLFTESGELGFFIIHALILNRLSINSRRIESLLMIFGLFSMSFAFYISVLLYYVLFFEKFTTRTRIVGSIVVSFVIFGLVMVVILLRSQNTIDIIYYFTIGRFMPSGDHAMVGLGSRADIFTTSLPHFLRAPWFGMGMDYTLERAPEANATIMGPLIAYGIIGTLIFFMHIIYFFILAVINVLKRHNCLAIKAFFILFLNYLQRPYVTSLFAYIIIIMMIHCIHFREESAPRGELACVQV